MFSPCSATQTFHLCSSCSRLLCIGSPNMPAIAENLLLRSHIRQLSTSLSHAPLSTPPSSSAVAGWFFLWRTACFVDEMVAFLTKGGASCSAKQVCSSVSPALLSLRSFTFPELSRCLRDFHFWASITLRSAWVLTQLAWPDMDAANGTRASFLGSLPPLIENTFSIGQR